MPSPWFRIVRHLTFQVLTGIVLGILVGVIRPEWADDCKVLADWFIQLVQWMVVPVIFFTVTLGIGGVGSLRQAGRIGLKALLYFEVVTTLALVLGILTAWWMHPGRGISTAGLSADTVKGFATGATAFSWQGFFLKNLTLQVLVAGMVAGAMLGRLPLSTRGHWLSRLEIGGHHLFTGLRWLMRLAPLGAFGGMAYTVGKFGIRTLLPLGQLMAAVYVTMALFIFGVLGLVLRWTGVGIVPYLRHIRDELLLVLGTSSSESALPQLIDKMVSLGCPRGIAGLVIPAGYSFNLDGTTIYLSMAIMFLLQAYQVPVELPQMLAIVGVLLITSKGAAGVTGAGFVTLASTLMAVKVVPVEGLALLIGVDRFMSEARSITNLIGNGVAALAVARSEGVLHLKTGDSSESKPE